jgi:hypothetical protein
MIGRIINVLILLAAITFIAGMAIGYGLLAEVFPASTFWKFTTGCLLFAVTLTLTQIRDK